MKRYEFGYIALIIIGRIGVLGLVVSIVGGAVALIENFGLGWWLALLIVLAGGAQSLLLVALRYVGEAVLDSSIAQQKIYALAQDFRSDFKYGFDVDIAEKSEHSPEKGFSMRPPLDND